MSVEPLPLALAQHTAATIEAIPGVASLHPGRFGEVALLFPRTRVRGLRRADPVGIEVHVTVDLDVLGLDANLHHFAEHVRRVAADTAGVPVTVVLADALYQE